jgi:hypothetical protein
LREPPPTAKDPGPRKSTAPDLILSTAFLSTLAAGVAMLVLNRPVVKGVTPRGCFWWCFVAYGILGGLVLILYTFRGWSRFDRAQKVIFALCVAFALACFGGIVVTWRITRS